MAISIETRYIPTTETKPIRIAAYLRGEKVLTLSASQAENAAQSVRAEDAHRFVAIKAFEKSFPTLMNDRDRRIVESSLDRGCLFTFFVEKEMGWLVPRRSA